MGVILKIFYESSSYILRCLWMSGIDVCVLIFMYADNTLMSRRDTQSGRTCWGMRCQKACSVSTGGQRCCSQIQLPIFFLPKESSVTQEFRLCFYSLSYYVSNDLRHSVLSFSLFAALKQTNRAAQREAKSAPFLTPLTCSLRARSAVSCACAVFNDMISLFCHLNCSSGILLKMNLCTTLQVFLLHCGAIK